MHGSSNANPFILKVIFLIFVSCCGYELTAQQATVTEASRSILTYPYSDPSPLPSMALSSSVRLFYPYFVFDGYTDRGEQKDWKVVSLDNEFISVTVLPEVGGKVWGAIENSTGDDFVYLNHVLKFRDIGIRGPWTSGGIEHNFGLDLGHAPWTASPVDYIVQKEPDGSVSCTVGGLNLTSRIQWRVKIRLPADGAYFETNSMWYNPTPLHDAYLSWENAAFRATGNLQFFFPGNFYIGHDGAVNPWPIDDQGRDLSFYEENNFGSSKSYHVSGYYTTWFGGYWHDSGFGFGHWTPYSDAPGKKIWIWSLARDGAIWEDLLTDNDGQYIEAQSGVKFNQADRASGYNSPYNQLSIKPYYTETKEERWFPVLGTGGMAAASGAGTINVAGADGGLKISVCPVISLKDSLKVLADGKEIFAAYLDLKPMQLYEQIISGSANDERKITVRVGNHILSYDSDRDHMAVDRPNRSVSNGDYSSNEHLFELAEDINAMRDYPSALKGYLACLEKEPADTRALYRVAELYYRSGQFREALAYARRALEINTYDPGANFIYGVIWRKLGDLTRAEEAFSIAARSMEFRSGSYLQIAEIRLLEADYHGATEYAGKALDFNRYNIAAWECLATGYRKMNMLKEAASALDKLLEIDPLDHYARFEMYLAHPTEELINDFKSLIRNELPHETYLELAICYAGRGMDDEAVKVLEHAPSNPVVWYWLAYLYRSSDPDRSDACLTKAVESSPYLVYPSRPETIPVLEWALQKEDSWKTRYYLGLIYWNLNRIDRATELFEQCGDLPDWGLFYLERSIFSQKTDQNGPGVLEDLKRAVSMDPGEWRTWHYLGAFLQRAGSFSEQMENARQAHRHFPANPVIGIDYAKALINSGSYRECLRVLETVRILPQEGAQEGHDVFETANLSLAVQLTGQKKFREALEYIEHSKLWPENLGAGRPYDPDERLQDLLAAYCYDKTGNPGMVAACNQRIIESSCKDWGGHHDPANIYIAYHVLKENGLGEQADDAMDRWIAEQDSLRNWSISRGSSSPKVQWAIAKCHGKEEEARTLEEKISAVPTETRFRILLEVLRITNAGTATAVMTNAGDTIRYYDGQSFTLIGKMHNAENYARFPSGYKSKLREDVWDLGQNSAGISIRFRTDSPYIVARWSLQEDNSFDHMALTGIKGIDLYAYVDGMWKYVNTGRVKGKHNEAILVRSAGNTGREYLLNLPLYDGVDSLSIGVKPGSVITPPVEKILTERMPVIYYGSSIAQGGCASRPGMAFTNILSRRLDRSFMNMGFSGSGTFDIPVGEAMCETDAALYVIDCNPNTDADLIYDRAVKLVELLKRRRPDTPVLMVEAFYYVSGFTRPPDSENARKNEELLRAFETLQGEGIKGLYYQKGDGLIGDDYEGTVDGVHPNDLGMIRMADALEPVIRKIIE